MTTPARVLTALLLGLLAVVGCSSTGTMDDEGVRTVSASEAQDLIDDGAVVIDVRMPEEFASGHLAGARNIDVQADSFHEEVDRLDRDAAYVLYCRTGSRAGAAADMMAEMGFATLANAGGFEDLAAAGLPTS